MFRRTPKKADRREGSQQVLLALSFLFFTVSAQPMHEQGAPEVRQHRVSGGNVSTTVFRGQELSYEVIDGLAVHGGDIILGTAEEALLAAPGRDRGRSSRDTFRATGSLEATYLWPNGVIPYVIDDELRDSSGQNILRAIAEWNTKTVITLKERTTETDYVRFKPGGCFSYLGRQGGEQLIGLRPEGCAEYVNVVVHEIGHAVGLLHEHQRRDRDRYLMMSPENIAFCYRYRAWTADAEPYGPYDYASAMHYGRGHFPDRPVFETIPPGLALTYSREPNGLSVGDIHAVARLYGQAPKTTTIVTNPPGLDVVVDGVRMTTPVSLDWAPGTEHRLEAPRQATSDDGYRFLFGRWSDDGSRAHTVTADPDITWFAANYIVQKRFTAEASPAEAGSVTILPKSADGFYTFGTRIELLASPNPDSGYRLHNWGWGDHFYRYQGWLPGEAWNPAYPVVGVGTDPPNLVQAYFKQSGVMIDSNVYNAWIEAVLPDGMDIGIPLPALVSNTSFWGDTLPIRGYDEVSPWDVEHRYRFESWSDGADIAREIVLSEGGSLTLNSSAFFPLQTIARVRPGSIQFSPPPATMKLETEFFGTKLEFFAEGTRVQLTAVPQDSNDEFVAWMGAASGSDPVTSVGMDTTRVVEAVFYPRGYGLQSGERNEISLPGISIDEYYRATRWVYVPTGSLRLEVDLKMPNTGDGEIFLGAHHGAEARRADLRGADFRTLAQDGVARIVVTPESTPPLTEGPYFITVASRLRGKQGTLLATVTGGPPVRTRPRAFTFASSTTFDPAPQTFRLSNEGDRPLQFQIVSSWEWLTAVPPSGTVTVDGAAEITVEVRSTGMLPDTYTGELSIQHAGQASPGMRQSAGPVIPVTLAVVARDPEDPSDFTSEDIAGWSLTLEEAGREGVSGPLQLRFGISNRFEQETEIPSQGSRTRSGSYTYEKTGPRMGRLTLNYDDGMSCEIQLSFTESGMGTYTYDCGDGDPVEGSFRLTASSLYYFPHLAVGASWQTTITYINNSAEEVTCQTDFVSDQGSPLMVSFGGLGRVESRTDVLPPGGSVHEETNVDLSAPLAPGWARANCSGPVKASLLFRRYNSEGVPTAEAGVNATTVPATRFVTFAEQGEDQFGTGVAYANPYSTAADVTFTARDTAGQVLASVNHNLPPGGHGSQNMVDLFDLTSFTGSIEITSTEPIVSLSLNFEADPIFSSLPPGESGAAAQGTKTYFFPHLAVGASWQTTITYINNSAEEVTCQTDFVSDQGSPLMVSFGGLGRVESRTDVLPPGGSVHEETNVDLSAPLALGWARANCSGPVKASLLFRRYNSEGVPTAEAGVNATTVPATRFVTFAEQGEDQFGTGVAYANPYSTAADVTFTARDTAGQVLASVNHNLPPGGHGSQNMVDLFDLTSFTGSIEITSTEPIVSLSLNFEADPIFSSLPPGETVDPPGKPGG